MFQKEICELSPPPTSAIYASSRMSGQTNMTSMGHSDWKLGAHTIYELHFGFISVDQFYHYNVMMSAMAPHITGLMVLFSYVLFGRRSKKISKFCVTGLCEGNSPVTGVWTAQKASNAEKFPFDDVIMIHSWFMNMAPQLAEKCWIDVGPTS